MSQSEILLEIQHLSKAFEDSRPLKDIFTLIFTAAIYFLIAGICIFLLDVADNKLNRRKKDVAE